MYRNSTEEGKRIVTYFCKVKEGEREMGEEKKQQEGKRLNERTNQVRLEVENRSWDEKSMI